MTEAELTRIEEKLGEMYLTMACDIFTSTAQLNEVCRFFNRHAPDKNEAIKKAAEYLRQANEKFLKAREYAAMCGYESVPVTGTSYLLN